MATRTLRCAIYTRKSSEEGLDQSFNSLDAQREACEAFVRSQACEGWEGLAARYDDGGFSGGNTERPGLKRLLADIEAGNVDIVVVYKIDRLTRSLADFARIVEIFERAECSFVSVTQSFNTTGSMGKLMLNVLLSFAQFEREVTGERIRDKIAASKAKGLWMGGNLPLGYDLPAEGTRILRVNDVQAETVRHIFTRYLDLGSVHALQRELSSQGVHSKRWTSAKGKSLGGKPFSRGALFHLLRNRIYLGQIVHKGEVHEGGHAAIVDPDLFERVQLHLDGNARRHGARAARGRIAVPLTGKLFDAAGEPMSPTASRGKSGRAYRYYVSASLQQGAKASDHGHIQRLSAPGIERVVADAINRWVPRIPDPFAILRTAKLVDQGLRIAFDCGASAEVVARLGKGEKIVDQSAGSIAVLLPMSLPLRGGRRLVVPSAEHAPRPDPFLIAALRKAHAMLTFERGLPVMTTAPASPYDRTILRLGLLAPDIQQAILHGRQPHSLNLEALRKIDIPLAWSAQRERLGFKRLTVPCSGPQ